jgi:phosphoenolpyruvate---glycerone phosphotransferase subunit DhaK
MKNLMNNVDTMLTESLTGFAIAHSDIVALGADAEFIRRKRNKPGKVALISGGGAGHEPLHAGFVGHGMLDAACPGQIFTSPTPNQMMNAAQSVDGGAGVLFIVKNYSGDMMNFQMAAEMLEQENEVVIVNDDVAVEDSTYTTGRRGVAGTFEAAKDVG